ncbi:MAG: metallophosphoesterase, partial [Hasllibacter sp.]
MTLYAVGDIHGHLAKLDRALDLIERDASAHGGGRVVFVGDLVDRGPDARGVIERLMAGQAEGRDWSVLLGNHDRMFLRFVRDGLATDPAISSGKGWFHGALGGAATLASYGVVADERSDPDAVRRAARGAGPPGP